MKVIMVGPQALARGFGLVGMETRTANSAKEAYEQVLQIVDRKDVGIVLISKDFYGPYQDKYFRMKISMERPILLEIPAVRETAESGENIGQFVKRATGVSV